MHQRRRATHALQPPVIVKATARAPLGMTLIELVVAISILSIASIAAWRSFDQAGRDMQGQLARGLAHQVALNHAAELRAAGLARGRSLPSEVTMGHQDWTIALAEAPTNGDLVAVTIMVSAPGSAGAQLVTFVPAGADP